MDYADRRIIRLLESIDRNVAAILRDLHPQYVLTTVRIVFTTSTPEGENSMATIGPVTLTAAGQVATASVVGFDQFGNPMPSDFVMPPVTWTDGDGSIIVLDPAAATVTAVANGVENVTASVTNEKGDLLSDTETVTVAIPVEAPVLSSIKIAFA